MILRRAAKFLPCAVSRSNVCVLVISALLSELCNGIVAMCALINQIKFTPELVVDVRLFLRSICIRIRNFMGLRY
jgi:ABC-type polysaccharide/polyol phosphate export permease